MVERIRMERICLTFVVLLAVFRSAHGINCYQCQSTDHENPYRCPEFFGDADPDGYHLEARACDLVHDAKFCVKQTGRFEAWGIRCYQCDSSKDLSCTDTLIQDPFNVLARSCEHIFEARYCVKTTGLYGGGLGTKRFCSSLDLGNYCNYVRQPGDDLEYRSCVYTCSSDGCNPAPRTASPAQPALLALLAGVMLVLAAVRL